MKKIISFILSTALVLCMFSFPVNAEEYHPGGLIADSYEDIMAIYDGADFSIYSSSLPTSVDNTSKFPTPGDQGDQKSCVGWAIGYAMASNNEHIKRNWNINTDNHHFSPSYIFNQLTSNGSAINIYSALNLVKNQGVCPLTYWQYDETDYTTQPTAIQNAAASLYKCASVYSTIGTVNIKARLAQGYGVVIGIEEYPDLYNLSNTNQIYDSTSGTSRGQHAICLIGYDDNKGSGAYKFINSWGTDWGLDGYGWISYDLVNGAANASAVKAGFYITSPTTDDYTIGDVNSDGTINSEDSRLALQYSVGSGDPTAMQYVLADVDGNGQITASDAREILRYSTDLIDHFSLYD